MHISSIVFGTTQDGKEVNQYTLINDHNHSVSIITYGGIITTINIPDKKGTLANVVLGYNNLNGYENITESFPYFGCLAGRFAGRISGAQFEINDKVYHLAKNNGDNCLHGGIKGLDKVVWNATEIKEKDYVGLALNYLSNDMEEGFPGNLDITVSYKWNNDNELKLTYIATTDKETLLTLTNHSYFNLSGDPSTTILDHKLQIAADKFIELNHNAIPTSINEVKGTPFDFRLPKTVGQDINDPHIQLQITGGYDHPFMLNNSDDTKIILTDEESGRTMKVSTNEKYVVFYSANALSPNIQVYDSIKVQKRSAVCLETQYCPDNINFELIPTKTLKPNETYRSITAYHFGITT